MKTMRLQQICRELGEEIERLTGEQSRAVIGVPHRQYIAIHHAASSDLGGGAMPASLELCGVAFHILAFEPKIPHQWPRAFDIEADGKVEHVELHDKDYHEPDV